MQRLLMGEVGSGKTVLALYAMLRAVEAGRQAALMAPTETLAEQHAATLDRLLASQTVPFTLLTSATPAARRRDALARLESGELGMVVGTHALIEPDVAFGRLAVCVVDEQHRFGVAPAGGARRQGAGWRGAPRAPHDRHADPAHPLADRLRRPRRDASCESCRRGGEPVDTWVVGEEKRAGAYEFIRARLREGRQAYVVCPLVEHRPRVRGGRARGEGGGGGGRAARDARSSRSSRSGSCTARCRPRDKQAAMEAFASGADPGAGRDERDRGGDRRRRTRP